MSVHRMTHPEGNSTVCVCALRRDHSTAEYDSFTRHPSNRTIA